MAVRILVALCTGIFLAAATNGASAAIWAWRCQGQVGAEQVLFNRDSLVVVAAKTPLGDIRKLSDKDINDRIEGDAIGYDPQNTNDGLVKTIEFLRHDDPKHKIVLTEKSSRRTSHKHKLICGRDEDTDIYRKVYSFQREDEPARDLAMQCLEYQLSTRGGRKGCD